MTYLFEFQCMECGVLGICNGETGKGALPPSQRGPSDCVCVCVCDFTLKYLVFLKVVAERSYHTDNPPPSLLITHPGFGSPTLTPFVVWGRLAPRGSISRDLGKPLRLTNV